MNLALLEGVPYFSKLAEVIEKVRQKQYDIFLVYSLDRFSRQHPSKTNALLDTIVYQYQCRFISLKESIDSQNEMIWHVMRPLFSYFANIYSRQLSEKIRAGIQNKRDKGLYAGGRPKKLYNLEKLKGLTHSGLGTRKIAQIYNESLPKEQQISHVLVGRLIKIL